MSPPCQSSEPPIHGLSHRARGRQVRLQTTRTNHPYLVSFFFCLRGVICLPTLGPYGYLAFFSAGFKICTRNEIQDF